ncbi:MAG: hypothetical protein AB1589_26145 [Cyanobacteriota bacterium]
MVRESISVGTVVKNLPDKEMEILLAWFVTNCNELTMPFGTKALSVRSLLPILPGKPFP